jgi:hypothetical protein
VLWRMPSMESGPQGGSQKVLYPISSPVSFCSVVLIAAGGMGF